jgi:hypothetical protein
MWKEGGLDTYKGARPTAHGARVKPKENGLGRAAPHRKKTRAEQHRAKSKRSGNEKITF